MSINLIDYRLKKVIIIWRLNQMRTIIFAGIKGKVVETSPHGNYVVVELSKRISIVGTFTNIFHWEESEEQQSGFISFITYIGLKSKEEVDKFKEVISSNEGYFNNNEDIPRKSKRVKTFPFEIKVRGLSPQSVVNLLNF